MQRRSFLKYLGIGGVAAGVGAVAPKLVAGAGIAEAVTKPTGVKVTTGPWERISQPLTPRNKTNELMPLVQNPGIRHIYDAHIDMIVGRPDLTYVPMTDKFVQEGLYALRSDLTARQYSDQMLGKYVDESRH